MHSTSEGRVDVDTVNQAMPDLVQAARQASMSVLAKASGEDLESFWRDWPEKPDFEILRGPETGLVMMRGRIGGGGAPFNVGEATVTRATVRLSNGVIGHSYALGRDQKKARLAALFDALWVDAASRDAVERDVLAVLRNRADKQDTKKHGEAAATKVDFFTMVRGDN